jgi:periplasmic divalent cation tolerance protein
VSETVTLVTCKNRKQATAIARTLVREKLAACVNVLPGIASIFRWEGRVEEVREVLLVIKSRRALSKKLISRVRALHSYQVPEVVTIPIASGNPAYLRWVRQSTR